MSRHFYDLYMLSKQGVAIEASNNMDLLDQVIRNTSIFWKRKHIDYSDIKDKGLILISNQHLKSLVDDYKKMQGMFFGVCPDFAQILSEIKSIENMLNQKILQKNI